MEGDRWAADFPFDGDVLGATAYLRATAEHGDQRPWGFYRITRAADGQAIGGIGFKGQPEDGCVEVGYGLAPSARGHGYAAEALAALISLAADPRTGLGRRRHCPGQHRLTEDTRTSRVRARTQRRPAALLRDALAPADLTAPGYSAI
ncbi:GNAT family N-acetyltransferase [Intrasporangium sp.]|uniref:GNAT family N-acetyltransferase n=1 Tax=Intrasporangium sp. TaxID=1925024 RepID=UPI003464CD74